MLSHKQNEIPIAGLERDEICKTHLRNFQLTNGLLFRSKENAIFFQSPRYQSS